MTYSADRPLSERTQDLLDRRAFAERIGRTLAARSQPESVVVGLYGPWGSGKTTVLNFMADYLEEEFSDRVVVLRYNPWVYANDEQMLSSFIRNVADGLELSLVTKGERFGELLEKGKGLLRLIPTIGGGASEIAGLMADALTTKELDKLKDDFSQALEDQGIRVVVLVDDLDRLMIGQLLAIFRLVKLVGDFDNTSYVLAFDEAVVSAALESGSSPDHPVGPGYLEKIVQVPIRIPEADVEVRLQLFIDEVNRVYRDHELLKYTDEDDRGRFGVALRLFVHITPTIRLAKRVINVLEFSLPLMPTELNVVDMTLLELLRVVSPETYDRLRVHRTEIVRGEKDYESIVEHVGGKGDALKELLWLLFPGPAVDVDYYGSRICSPEYVDRYFLYGLQKGSVSDRLADEFLADPSSESSLQWLEESLATAAFDLSFKLRSRVSNLDRRGSESVVQSIVERANKIPDELDNAGVSSMTDRVALLLLDLCRQPAKEEAPERVSQMVADCEEPNLALAVVKWSHLRDAQDNVLSANQQRDLMGQKAMRCLEDLDRLSTASLAYLVRETPSAASHEIVREACSDWVREQANLNRLVLAALPEPGTMIVRTGYDNLAHFVDPDEIKGRLGGGYKNALDRFERYEHFRPPFFFADESDLD